MQKQSKKEEILKFMLVGGVSALVHYICYISLLALNISYNISYAVSYILGIVCNFLGSNYFTFHTTPTIARAIKFAISNGVNFLNHMLLLNISVYVGITEKIAPVVVYTIAFPLNFLMIKYSLIGNKGVAKTKISKDGI